MIKKIIIILGKDALEKPFTKKKYLKDFVLNIEFK